MSLHWVPILADPAQRRRLLLEVSARLERTTSCLVRKAISVLLLLGLFAACGVRSCILQVTLHEWRGLTRRQVGHGGWSGGDIQSPSLSGPLREGACTTGLGQKETFVQSQASSEFEDRLP